MTFMTFYTPTYKRPTYLTLCRRSVQAQTCRDFQHMVIVDDSGIGVDGMFHDIRRHAKAIRGDYVFILADDDRLLQAEGLERVKAFAMANNRPPVIIVRNYKWEKTFPLIWEQAPEYTKIDTGNFIIRSDVFRENAEQFGECYEGDWVFIEHLWKSGYPFAWFDYVFSEMQVGGRGRTEVEIMKDRDPMLVRALIGFSSIIDGHKLVAQKGQILLMPAGADWVTAGLATPVRTKPLETATKSPAEKAVTRASDRKGWPDDDGPSDSQFCSLPGKSGY